MGLSPLAGLISETLVSAMLICTRPAAAKGVPVRCGGQGGGGVGRGW